MATLDFKGKALVQNYHLSVKYHELVPKRDRSLTNKVRLDDNLIIHGDNLKALKALLPTYAGQVKCICIDPPYNTGNEGWAYNDNVNSPMMQEWFGEMVDFDDDTRHDKWLCMMLPRLKLLKELLSDDGFIFVFCDDNESLHLRRLMEDGAFTENNFVGTFIWKKKGTSTNVRGAEVSSQTDYIIAYRKSAKAKITQRMRSKEERNYPNTDEEGNFRTTIIEKKHAGSYARDTMVFKILGKPPRAGKRWQIGEKTARKLEAKNRFMIEDGVVKLKIYDFEDRDTFSANPNLLENCGTSDSAASLVNEEIFGQPELFDNPKPVELIGKLLGMAGADGDAIVLDSFGGSGTTAHAVLALNKEDGGNRKFILVECEDYADSITAERLRRVIKGVKGASDENLKKGLGGTFSYFELGKAIELDSILDGKNLPSYLELARYVFYTATGEEFDERKVNEKRSFVGESKTHEVYLFYQPDMDYLKKTALTLERAESLGKIKDKRRLVFAPTKYLDQEQLDALRIDFAQLPFEIYKLAT
jgi:adenine-specific DNA-methyltransferase